ncbi:hypothetical protein MG293_013290 [Ovis ammon polii]|uniref:Uncharacterized protein n=1 Tax=Ovis ammon polii TaxID=230172 RepID=A0AAD4Y7A9_OVIAM|nr:hypothetical protein MG293_013290 [Ovis ammon polii]
MSGLDSRAPDCFLENISSSDMEENSASPHDCCPQMPDNYMADNEDSEMEPVLTINVTQIDNEIKISKRMGLKYSSQENFLLLMPGVSLNVSEEEMGTYDIEVSSALGFADSIANVQSNTSLCFLYHLQAVNLQPHGQIGGSAMFFHHKVKPHFYIPVSANSSEY